MTTSETAEAMLAARAPEPLGVWRRRNANRPGGDNDGDARRRAGRAVQRRPVVLRRYSRAAHRRGPGISAPFDSVLTEAVDALKNGQLSSRELTLACVERAHSWQPEINALLAIEKERALASADAADSARARGETLGLLHGVPFAQKDMYDRAGQETSCGSKIRTDHIASLTATVLERLDAAGAVDLGRLNMSEFALGPTGLNAHGGRAIPGTSISPQAAHRAAPEPRSLPVSSTAPWDRTPKAPFACRRRFVGWRASSRRRGGSAASAPSRCRRRRTVSVRWHQPFATSRSSIKLSRVRIRATEHVPTARSRFQPCVTISRA
jgi:hypothetical protein